MIYLIAWVRRIDALSVGFLHDDTPRVMQREYSGKETLPTIVCNQTLRNRLTEPCYLARTESVLLVEGKSVLLG